MGNTCLAIKPLGADWNTKLLKAECIHRTTLASIMIASLAVREGYPVREAFIWKYVELVQKKVEAQRAHVRLFGSLARWALASASSSNMRPRLEGQ
jgi:hypothetical protein